MVLAGKDLASLKLPATVLLGAVLVAVLIVNLSMAKLDQARQQLEAEGHTLREAQQRYHRSGEDVEIIHRYLPEYRQLQERGFVGKEQRVNWIEGLRAANQRAGLLGVTYRLSPQTGFPYVSRANPMAQQLKHSEMKLSFGLIHEGELMRLFNALEAQRPGVFALTACSLDRGLKTGNPIPREANLTAECDLSWLTVQPEGGSP